MAWVFNMFRVSDGRKWDIADLQERQGVEQSKFLQDRLRSKVNWPCRLAPQGSLSSLMVREVVAIVRGISSPTLLLVGELDLPVIKLNEEAYARLRCEKRLIIIPGATHLFEEPGALEEVASLAAEWFKRYWVRGDH